MMAGAFGRWIAAVTTSSVTSTFAFAASWRLYLRIWNVAAAQAGGRFMVLEIESRESSHRLF